MVIGAGAAGMTVAMELRKRGYETVRVLEKEAHVGGKCQSLFYGGRNYDLGANLHTERYTLLRYLGAELGMTERSLLDRRIVNLSAEEFDSLQDANLLERVMVRGGASFYNLVRGTTGVERDGFTQVRPGARRSFRDWLDRNQLDAFEELFASLFIAFGYGPILDLPAAYALKFFDPIHLRSSIRVILGEEIESTKDWAEGFQEIWERVDRHYQIEARREAHVKEVRRSPRGVDVSYTWQGQEIDEHFDAIVLALPFTEAHLFLDTSPEEDRLFGKIRLNDYYATAATLGNVQPNVHYVYPWARRYTPGEPMLFYKPYADPDDPVHMFYAYGGDGIDESVVRDNIAKMVARPEFNGELGEFITTKHWRYFPHVDVQTMQDGFFEDFEAMQGEFHTYYVGELLSYSLTELVMRYSRRLVDERF